MRDWQAGKFHGEECQSNAAKHLDVNIKVDARAPMANGKIASKYVGLARVCKMFARLEEYDFSRMTVKSYAKGNRVVMVYDYTPALASGKVSPEGAVTVMNVLSFGGGKVTKWLVLYD